MTMVMAMPAMGRAFIITQILTNIFKEINIINNIIYVFNINKMIILMNGVMDCDFLLFIMF